MKKSILLAISVLLSCSLGFAQDNASAMSTTLLEEQGNSGKFSVSVEPIWLIISGIGLGVNYNLSSTKSIDLKGMKIFNYLANENDEDDSSFSVDESYRMSREEINLGMTFMLTGDFGSNGVYLSPSIGYVKAEISEYGTQELQGEAETPIVRFTGGYRWALNNGINFNVGGGLAVTTSDFEIKIKDSSGNVIETEEGSATGGLALDAAISYTF